MKLTQTQIEELPSKLDIRKIESLTIWKIKGIRLTPKQGWPESKTPVYYKKWELRITDWIFQNNGTREFTIHEWELDLPWTNFDCNLSWKTFKYDHTKKVMIADDVVISGRAYTVEILWMEMDLSIDERIVFSNSNRLELKDSKLLDQVNTRWKIIAWMLWLTLATGMTIAWVLMKTEIWARVLDILMWDQTNPELAIKAVWKMTDHELMESNKIQSTTIKSWKWIYSNLTNDFWFNDQEASNIVQELISLEDTFPFKLKDLRAWDTVILMESFWKRMLIIKSTVKWDKKEIELVL